MRIRVRPLTGVAALICLAGPGFAADYGGGGRYGQPSADAEELAALAPPARPSTAVETYGDAQIARSRFQRRYHRRGPDALNTQAPLGIVPCEPRTAFAAGYGCKVNTQHVGYGQFYAYTPAYVTSPQVPRYVPSVDDSLLPPATSFFFSANSYLFGRAN